MTRVLHTADTHLGYRQYHSPARREDFAAAFRQVVADAAEGEFDAVVHAGDLFHDRRPALSDLLAAVGVLRDLRDAGVPFLAVVGNHERKRSAQWLDLFADLGLATRLDAGGTVVGDVAFYGLDYVPESRRDRLDYDFDPRDADHAALVAHGLFTPFAHGTWDTEAVLDAATVDFDAVLLGDNHHPGTEEVAGTWVTYPGSTERVSADEREDRGYNIVEFDDEVRISRRALPGRAFVFVDVELAPGEGGERVRDRLAEHDLDDAVVVVTVDGEGDPVTPAEVETFAEDEGALLARVRDRRELDPDAETGVYFADPDEAVRERVRELGLSGAARDVDETVRDDDLADSNVRERTKELVRERLDGDPAAFEPADPGAAGEGDAEAVGEGDVEAAGESDEEASGGDAEAAGDDGTGDEGDGAGDEAASGSAEGGAGDGPADGSAASDAAAPDGGEAGDGATDSADGEETGDGETDRAGGDDEPAEPSDGQASMEEFL